MKGKTVPVEVIQLKLSHPEIQNVNYNWKRIFNKTHNSFKDLNIDLRLKFHSIRLAEDNLIEPSDILNIYTEEVYKNQNKAINRSFNSAKYSILKGSPTDGVHENQHEEKLTDSSRQVIDVLEFLKSYRKQIKNKNSIKVIFSDFNGSGGVSTSYGSEENEFIVMDNSYSEDGFIHLLTHELGHKFGLPHTVTSQDVMSYHSLRKLSQKIKGRPHFSYESKFNWSQAKIQIRQN